MTGRVTKFGPGDVLLGALTESSGHSTQVGAILWGLGVAEMKTARRLVKYGITCLQVRINGPDFNNDDKRNAIYDVAGIEYCRTAMDKLAVDRGIKTFILMGNCACANLCFNTAVIDPRVTGLILTNPLILKEQMLEAFFWERLMGLRRWKRLMGGKTDLRGRLKLLVGRVFGGPGVGSQEQGVKSSNGRCLSRDVLLSADMDRQLRALCGRDVKVLIACASSDDSFRYLGIKHREVLSELNRGGHLWFEKVESDAHVFSTDDDAAKLLNDTVSRWVDATFGKDTVEKQASALVEGIAPLPGAI